MEAKRPPTRTTLKALRSGSGLEPAQPAPKMGTAASLIPAAGPREPRPGTALHEGSTGRGGPLGIAQLLTPAQVAEALQVSRGLVSVLIKRGDLPAIYVGRLPRVRTADLQAFINARLGGAA